MKHRITTAQLCRAAAIAALYAAIVLIQPYSSTPVQCRLSEALTVLPLFFPEAVPGLFVGCFLANVVNSPADMFLGSAATLIAAVVTYLIGRFIKNKPARLILGELPPVAINALLVPVVFLINDPANTVYLTEVGLIAAGQAIAIGLFGTALYFAIDALRKKGVRVFLDKKDAPLPAEEPADGQPQSPRDGRSKTDAADAHGAPGNAGTEKREKESTPFPDEQTDAESKNGQVKVETNLPNER